MSKEKKNGVLGKLFKSGGCNCGVQVVEEKEEKPVKLDVKESEKK